VPTLIVGPSMSWLDGRQLDGLSESAPGLRVVRAYSKDFPDGESYVRLPPEGFEPKDDVVILQSLSPPQDRALVQLLQLVDAALNMGAERVAVFAPYLAYSRQDKVFLPGEPVSVRVVLSSLYSAGARLLFTIDAHNPKSLSLFPGKAVNLLPLELLVEPIIGELPSTEDALILAPDKGAIERAKTAAERFGLNYDYFDKKRDRVTGEVSIDDRGIEVRGKRVIVIDDIISTGGTLSLAIGKLYERGAKEVHVACSHALLVGDSLSKILSKGAKSLTAFNTLPPKSGVRYVEVLKWSLRKILEHF